MDAQDFMLEQATPADALAVIQLVGHVYEEEIWNESW